MRRMWLLLALSGCYRTVIYSGRATGMTPIRYDERMHHGFVSGLIPGRPVNLDEACPQGWAEVATRVSAADGALSYVTYSVYTPTTLRVTCAGR